MKALTLWQPYASLVIEGAKAYEYRGWRAPRWTWNRRVVIHAGRRRPAAAEIAGLAADIGAGLLGSIGSREMLPRAAEVLEGMWREPASVPLGCGLGTAILGEPRRAIETPEIRSLLPPDEIDEDMWAWPVRRVVKWPEPVPMNGARGFWDWPEAASTSAGNPAPDGEP